MPTVPITTEIAAHAYNYGNMYVFNYTLAYYKATGLHQATEASDITRTATYMYTGRCYRRTYATLYPARAGHARLQ